MIDRLAFTRTGRWLGLPTTLAAGTRACWWARVIVESTLTCHSMTPAASASTCSDVTITDHAPARCQRRNSPYTACQDPYSAGTSRHGDPTRVRHRIPSMS
ncbi:hypothetical protein [Nocardia sp. NPDC004123]